MVTRNRASVTTGTATANLETQMLPQEKMVQRVKATVRISREVLQMLRKIKVKASQHLKSYKEGILNAPMIKNEVQEMCNPLMKVLLNLKSKGSKDQDPNRTKARETITTVNLMLLKVKNLSQE
jgi:hypothetical protein